MPTIVPVNARLAAPEDRTSCREMHMPAIPRTHSGRVQKYLIKQALEKENSFYEHYYHPHVRRHVEPRPSARRQMELPRLPTWSRKAMARSGSGPRWPHTPLPPS
jgi:hypothetical protein